MTAAMETGLLTLAGGVAVVAKDMWIRVRTDRHEQRLLDLEIKRFDADERARAEERDRVRTEAEEVGKISGVMEASQGWWQITQSELTLVRGERDEARQDVSALRVALETVVAALVGDNRRLQAQLDAADARRRTRKTQRADEARIADEARATDGPRNTDGHH